MNEEISTPGTAVELDTDIVKATLVDRTLNNAEYDTKTAYVTRTVNGEQMIAWAEAEQLLKQLNQQLQTQQKTRRNNHYAFYRKILH